MLWPNGDRATLIRGRLPALPHCAAPWFASGSALMSPSLSQVTFSPDKLVRRLFGAGTMTMKRTHLAMALALPLSGIGAGVAAQPTEKYERKGRSEYVYEYKNGYREVKRERKRGEYKEEVKGRGSERKYEAKADGSWKQEIKRGNCVIKRERASNGEYKEERSC